MTQPNQPPGNPARFRCSSLYGVSLPASGLITLGDISCGIQLLIIHTKLPRTQKHPRQDSEPRPLQGGPHRSDTAYLRDLIARIADHKITRIDELLPWNWTKVAEGTGNAEAA